MIASRRLALSIVMIVALFMVGMLAATAATSTFSNTASIAVPATGSANQIGPAGPYPSTITVSGMSGTITDVNVTLTGISHTIATDLDILLVGPGVESVILMSDISADGGYALSNVTLILDDAADASLPSTQVVSGTYKPTNIAGNCDSDNDVFPGPAPAGPYGSALSVFNGTNPNGTWSLYVVDDCSGDTGVISGGWSLEITDAVTDTEPPVLTVPANITAEATGPDGAVVTFNATATDNSGSVTVTCTPASGSTFGLGSTPVECIATDAANNSDSDTFTVTVIDTEDPVLTVPANMTVSTDLGEASAVVNFSATATDNSGSATVTCTPASGSTFDLGSTIVSCTATDAANNTDTDTFTVTVIDTEDPVITVPDNITVSADTGQAEVVVNFSATATDNASTPTVVCDPPSGSTFPIGTTTVECTATDAASNTDSDTFTVTVTDDEDPVLTVPANIAVGTDAGQASAVVTFTATATDNSGAATVGCDPSSGSAFPIGMTTVDCTATDAAGNTDTGSFTVTVTDDEMPVLTVPADMSVIATGPTGAIVTYTVTATDNSGPVTASCDIPSGTLFGVGDTVVTCSVSDGAGNSASDTFTVTVLGSGDLLTELRSVTTELVNNPIFERMMVLTLTLADRLLDRGQPQLAQLYLRFYDLQITLGTMLRQITPDDAATLRTMLNQVRNSMS